jgi:hypothetical protein
MNDKEVRRAADQVASSADRFKKELDSSLKRDTTIDKVTRETSVNAADSLKQDAEELADTGGGARPASGEAQALLQRAAALRILAARSGGVALWRRRRGATSKTGSPRWRRRSNSRRSMRWRPSCCRP